VRNDTSGMIVGRYSGIKSIFISEISQMEYNAELLTTIHTVFQTLLQVQVFTQKQPPKNAEIGVSAALPAQKTIQAATGPECTND